MFKARSQFIPRTQLIRRFVTAATHARWPFVVLLAMFAIAAAPLSARAQAPFSDAKAEECFEILGLQMMVVLDRDPAGAMEKIRKDAEARSAEMQKALDNIRGDFLLSFDFGNLNRYESTYLEAAISKAGQLDIEILLLTREIECWRHLEKIYKLARLKRPPAPPVTSDPGQTSPPPPADPDPFGTGKLFELAKEYFDKRAEEVKKLKNRLAKNKKLIRGEIDRRKQINVAQPVPPPPPRVDSFFDIFGDINTRPSDPFGGLRGYVGAEVSLGTDNDIISLTPGNQTIDLDSKTGWAVRGGVVLPITGPFAVGAGVKHSRSKDATVRLNNPNGTFVDTGGSNEIEATVGEFSGLLTLPNNVTVRATLYEGRAKRKIDLTIGGVPALDFSDTVNASGYGFGIGVPAAVFGFNVPGLCFNGGIDVMEYGGANGLTPGGAPIALSGIDDTRATLGATLLFRSPTLREAHSENVTATPREICM